MDVASLPAVPGTSEATKEYRLVAGARDHLVARSRAEYPREACGVLVWHPETRVRGHLDAINVAQDPERRFQFDGKTMKKLRQYMTEGWKLEAIWHSHPNGRLTLSADDIRDATAAGRPLYPGVLYLVVGLIPRADRLPWAAIAGFLWETDGFRPVRITLDELTYQM